MEKIIHNIRHFFYISTKPVEKSIFMLFYKCLSCGKTVEKYVNNLIFIHNGCVKLSNLEFLTKNCKNLLLISKFIWTKKLFVLK